MISLQGCNIVRRSISSVNFTPVTIAIVTGSDIGIYNLVWYDLAARGDGSNQDGGSTYLDTAYGLTSRSNRFAMASSVTSKS